MEDRYFDRKGMEISSHSWNELFNDWNYRQVAKDTINGFYISTVWQGLDMASSRDPHPLYYDTTVFDPDGKVYGEMVLYGSDEEALKGHAKIVEEMKEVPQPPRIAYFDTKNFEF
jgi:hypothetical protein